MKTLLKLQSETEIKFDNFRNFDGSEYGLVLHEKIKTFIQYQIQKAYSNGREEVLKKLRVRIDTWGGFEDEGGNLCHYDSQIIEYLDDLSIQSKEK